MPDYANLRHSKHLITWCAAHHDAAAWMYTTYEHYAFLRDKLNSLHRSGDISTELRNELMLDAFNHFQSMCRRNVMAHSSYQYGHLYDILDGEEQVGCIGSDRYFELYGPPAQGGLITPGYPNDDEWELRGYVDFTATTFAVVRGTDVHLPDGRIWKLRLARPRFDITHWANQPD